MNRFSLQFTDDQLENKFQSSIKAKILIQCKILTILMVFEESLVSINAVINEYYLASIFLSSILLVYIGFYGVLVKYPHKINYGIFWFNNLAFSLPIALQIYIFFIDVNIADKICVTMGIMNVIPQFVLSQNILIDSGLYLYTMIMISISYYQLIGFSWFLVIPSIFTLSWISQKYETIKLERTFFSESQTNECLASVLRRICKEKIMIFTYDDTNIKYQEYLLNDECNKYFQDCPINQILSNIFVTYNEIQVSMSSYIQKNIIQNHNEDEFYSEAFQGYFKEKKNKINIELYVQTTSKTFFTIKITEIQKENCFSKTKAKQLLQIQNKVLHKILPKYIEIFQRDLQLTTKFQLFYKFMNQQISILRLHIVCNSKNIQFIIKRFDLVHQISQQFNKVNRRFFLQLNKNKEMDPQYQQLEQIQEAFISSDQFLMGMFLENILMLIRVTIDQDSLVNIQVIYEGDYIRIEFQYQSLQQLYISDKNYQKLVKSLGKLTELIGIKGSLVIKQSIIQITLINFLEISYQ